MAFPYARGVHCQLLDNEIEMHSHLHSLSEEGMFSLRDKNRVALHAGNGGFGGRTVAAGMHGE